MDFDDVELAPIALLLLDSVESKKRRRRTQYVSKLYRNRGTGDLQLIMDLRDDPKKHFNYYRMTKENFDEILWKIGTKIAHAPTHASPITPIQRLSMTLRFLASGENEMSLTYGYRVSPSSVSVILRETLNAIVEELQDFVKEPDASAWSKVADEFEKKWQFPNCIGALDGKHVRIKSPDHSGSQYYNYKGFFSIVLMAVVGPNYEFLLYEHGASGSNSDGGTYKRSVMAEKIQAGHFQLPSAKDLGDGNVIPPVIVADDAFSLSCSILKPYPGKYLALDKKVYNYRLSRARMVVENAFGLLAARWRIYHALLACDLDLVNLIIAATIRLHNFLLRRKDTMGLTVDSGVNGETVRGSWRDEIDSSENLLSTSRLAENCPDTPNDGNIIRDQLKTYFMSAAGQVSWQLRSVSRTQRYDS